MPEFTITESSLTSLEKLLLALTFTFGICTIALSLTLAIRSRTTEADGQVIDSPCTINLKNFDNAKPIFLKHGTVEILYPTGNEITIQNNELLEVICPGGLLGVPNRLNILVLQCKASTFLTSDNELVDIKNLQCQTTHVSTARSTGSRCLNNFTEIEIGFEISYSRFLRQIDLCFDDTTLNTLYAHSTIDKRIENQETGVPRPFFEQDDFYSKASAELQELYKLETQRKTVNLQLGLEANSTEIIGNSTNEQFLSRGHLVAKADFFYGYQQNATFHYVNAVPQWQFFNGHTWENAESSVRQYAIDKQINLEVYTGTHEILQLNSTINKNETEIYLDYVNNTIHFLPVPKYFWKIVYNEKTKAGIAIVGVNKLQNDVPILCTEIKSEWLHINNTAAKAGYTYACDVNDMRKKVITAPNLEVKDILK